MLLISGSVDETATFLLLAVLQTIAPLSRLRKIAWHNMPWLGDCSMYVGAVRKSEHLDYLVPSSEQ